MNSWKCLLSRGTAVLRSWPLCWVYRCGSRSTTGLLLPVKVEETGAGISMRGGVTFTGPALGGTTERGEVDHCRVASLEFSQCTEGKAQNDLKLAQKAPSAVPPPRPPPLPALCRPPGLLSVAQTHLPSLPTVPCRTLLSVLRPSD